MKEVFGCSAELIDSLGVKENAVDASEGGSDEDKELMKTLTSFIYDYLYVGKPEAINSWVNALQVRLQEKGKN